MVGNEIQLIITFHGHSFFQFFESVKKFRQSRVKHVRFAPLLIIHCGHHAAHQFASFNRFRHASSGCDYCSVADCDVLIGSYLSGQNAAATNLSSAGKTGQRSNHSVFADFDVVADLDQVVEFGSAMNASFAKTCAINAAVGSEFDIIFDDDPANL